ncbi:hypothetical protein [Croceicoccus ponticola]|uniref:hypothetical protein n=1 Tax=Croceicoccus ponticola TaxID=2217664 RepID=UPI0013E4072C|nr:hypothetical protein [Croceicoccus ponticola]
MTNEDRIKNWQAKRPEHGPADAGTAKTDAAEIEAILAEAKAERSRPTEPAAHEQPVEPLTATDRLRAEIDRRRLTKRDGILRRIAIFLGIPIAIVIAYAAFFATPLYEGEAAFTVQTSSGSGGSSSNAGLIAFPGSSTTISDAFKARAFILSRPMMQYMERTYGYMSHFHDMDPLTRPGGVLGNNANSLDYYRKRVKVSIDIQEGILRLTVQARTPEDAVRFGKGLLEAAERHVNDSSQRIAEDQMAGLNQNAQSAERQLTSARAKVGDVRTRQREISPEQSAAVIYQLISALELQLAEAERQRQSLADDGLVDSPLLPPLKSRIAELRAQIEDNRNRLSSDKGGSLAQTAGAFEDANTMQEIALARWQGALDTLQQASLHILAERRYFVLIVDITANDNPDVRDWWKIIVPTFLAFFLILGIIALLRARGALPESLGRRQMDEARSRWK